MRLSELYYRSPQLGGDSGDARFVGYARGEVARWTDDQSHFARAWERLPLRPNPARAREITGQDIYVATGHERADAGFELLHRAIP